MAMLGVELRMQCSEVAAASDTVARDVGVLRQEMQEQRVELASYSSIAGSRISGGQPGVADGAPQLGVDVPRFREEGTPHAEIMEMAAASRRADAHVSGEVARLREEL